jgi:nucleotide-binding universal stress UspA family protein
VNLAERLDASMIVVGTRGEHLMKRATAVRPTAGRSGIDERFIGLGGAVLP